MADTLNSRNITTSATKAGQWKLVAGLAVVFVILIAFGGEEATDLSGTSSVPKSESAAPAVSGVVAASGNASAKREIQWPLVPLEFLLTHNPFHNEISEAQESDVSGESNVMDIMAMSTPPADSLLAGTEITSADSDTRTETTPQAHADLVVAQRYVPATEEQSDMKVQMLFRSARGKAAIIDNRVYHEGDRINGFEIALIASDGVTLKSVETPVTSGEAVE